MNFSIPIKRSYLKVISAIASNFTVVWIVAIFAAESIQLLISNLFLAILSLIVALRTEDALEELEL